MRIPVIHGLIDRRILVNFRIDPDVLRRVVPEPFRPKLANGFGMAGICLIRLKQIRPRFVPSCAGISSENTAHRIAVEWESESQVREGVFVLRRDTSSWLNSAAGGKIFPGIHHHARFDVDEDAGHYSIVMNSDDGQTHVVVEGRATANCPAFQSSLLSKRLPISSNVVRWAIRPPRNREPRWVGTAKLELAHRTINY